MKIDWIRLFIYYLPTSTEFTKKEIEELDGYRFYMFFIQILGFLLLIISVAVFKRLIDIL
jgi:hypothetical protein